MLTPSRAGFAAVLVTLTVPLFAQDLAVKDRTPANPLFIVSVPDSPGFWKSFGESKFGQMVEREIVLPGLSPVEKAGLEKALGFSLEPSDLFTQTVKGFDAYFLELNDERGFVVNFSLRDATTATKILDQVKLECASAQGNAGGVSASTVVDTVTAEGVRQLSLPAFQLYLAADGSTLIWSNQRESLESTLRDEGKAIYSSEYFKRYMDELKNDPGKVWIFGEAAQAAPIAKLEDVSVPAGENLTLGAKVDADKSRLKVTTFQHQEDMPSAEKRYTLTAPNGGDISILNYLPENTSAFFGTNHFDGPSMLEVIEEEAKAKGDEESPFSAKSIDEKVQSGKALLGFDAKEDILANIGPELAIGITQTGQAKDEQYPFDLFAVFHVKNRDRFEAVLKTLEDSVGSASAAPTPRKRQPKSADPNAVTPTPTPEPTPAVQTEDFEGETIRFAASVPGAPSMMSNLQPGYAFTSDDYFIFALKKDTIKGVISASKGSKGIADAPLMKDVNSQLGGSHNDLILIDGVAVYDILSKQKESTAGFGGAGVNASFEKLLKYLGTIRSFSAATTYSAAGEKQEIVLLF